jgi:hypothetical protein
MAAEQLRRRLPLASPRVAPAELFQPTKCDVIYLYDFRELRQSPRSVKSLKSLFGPETGFHLVARLLGRECLLLGIDARRLVVRWQRLPILGELFASPRHYQ